MKKTLFILLSLLLTASSSWSQDTALKIQTEAEFRNFAAAVNAGNNFSGRNVLLVVDITLNEDWIPIGTTGAPFQGTFDGQGHLIKNLNVNIDGQLNGNVAGLFGCVGQQGIVRRVAVESGIIRVANKSDNDASCYVGGIAGLCAGRIQQCANRGATVLGNQTQAYVGGIVGGLGNIGGGTTSATVEDCYNLGRIFTSKTEHTDNNYLGGIVGDCDGTVQRVYVSTAVDISNAAATDRIANLRGVTSALSQAYYEGDMTGFALDGSLNTQGDYAVWTFANNQLPELTAISQPSTLLVGDVDLDGQITLTDLTCLINLIKDASPVKPSADVNLDSKLNLKDVAALVQILLKQ